MRRVTLTALIVLTCLCALPRSASAAAITFASATITNSNPFDVDIQIQNVSGLYAFVFDLVYDPTVVELVTVQEGTFLTDTTIPPTTPPNPTAFGFDGSVSGTISLFNVLLGAPAGATGTGSLALVTFRPLMNGSAALAFQNLDFTGFVPLPPCGDDEPDGCPAPFVSLSVNATPGQIAIRQTTPVPEPATIALFGLGLGLIGARRRLR